MHRTLLALLLLASPSLGQDGVVRSPISWKLPVCSAGATWLGSPPTCTDVATQAELDAIDFDAEGQTNGCDDGELLVASSGASACSDFALVDPATGPTEAPIQTNVTISGLTTDGIRYSEYHKHESTQVDDVDLTLHGPYFDAWHTGTAVIGGVTGLSTRALVFGGGESTGRIRGIKATGMVTDVADTGYAVSGARGIAVNGGTTTWLMGGDFDCQADAGTTQKCIGVAAGANNGDPSTGVVHHAGVLAATQQGGSTSNTAVLIGPDPLDDGATWPTGDHAIYSSDPNPSYLAADLDVLGDITLGDGAMHVGDLGIDADHYLVASLTPGLHVGMATPPAGGVFAPISAYTKASGSSTGTRYGLFANVLVDSTSTGAVSPIALQTRAWHQGTVAAPAVQAASLNSRVVSGSTAAVLDGMIIDSRALGTVTSLHRGVRVLQQIDGTVADALGVTITRGGSGTVTGGDTGLLVEWRALGAKNLGIGLLSDDNTVPAGTWALYSEPTEASYMAGSLHVDGYFRPDNASAPPVTCDVSVDGALYYDTDVQRHCACVNGTGWVQIDDYTTGCS